MVNFNLDIRLICIAVGIGSVIWRTIAILIIRPIIVNNQLYILEE